MVPAPNSGSGSAWLVRTGEMAQHMAEYPWERTPFGPLGGWPEHLRFAVNLMLRGGSPMALIWGPEFRLLYNDLYAELLQDKHTSELGRRGQDLFSEVWPALHPLFLRAYQGEAVTLEDVCLPIKRQGMIREAFFSGCYTPVANAQGVIDGFLAMVVETTPRVKRAALSAGAIGTWSWNVKENRVTADRVFAQFFFVPEAEGQAVPLEAYLPAVHPEDRPAVEQAIQAAIRDRAPYNVDCRLIGSDRSTRWVSARGFLELDAAGEPDELLGTVLDITDRKMLEQQVTQTVRELRESQVELERQAISLEETVKARTASLEETVSELESFSYSISHDLRGPLRSLQSFAEALREDFGGQVPVAGQDYIRRIVAGASRMDRIIQDVLVYSRVARSNLTFERIDLDNFIAGLVDIYPSLAPSQADIFVAGPLPAVAANPAVLTQCVANLLSNAVKFVAAGVRPMVRISAETREGRVFVAIKDNGIGIPEGSQQRVFELFHRLEPSYEGTGIGLAIVRRAIGRMGGRITLQSTPGKGSTFTFDLQAGD